jgi:hypothetical protein
VWERLHTKLLDRLGEAEQIEWEGHPWTHLAWPPPGGQKTGPNPTDKGKSGSKRHVDTRSSQNFN